MISALTSSAVSSVLIGLDTCDITQTGLPAADVLRLAVRVCVGVCVQVDLAVQVKHLSL